ncbi:TetR family transcriptional regulator [Nocardia cerradoensis]|uniref:TetR family transcriptional regulator n=1 Tax=Nocardia cerradoensis TaxID=85688 RepID=UPI001CB98B9F|nr:TetR family transcriptional regulator [Nocardia cerradoensis]
MKKSAGSLTASGNGANASLAELASAAGISKPLIYAYLGSRDGLHQACVHRAGRSLVDAFAAAQRAHGAHDKPPAPLTGGHRTLVPRIPHRLRPFGHSGHRRGTTVRTRRRHDRHPHPSGPRRQCPAARAVTVRSTAFDGSWRPADFQPIGT